MKHFLFIVTITAFTGPCLAQGYHPVLRNDVLWEVRFAWADNGELLYLDHEHWWLNEGDTVVDGYLYKKFNRHGSYFREDTATGRIYQRDNLNDSSEYLLYDFSMEIGDSIYSLEAEPQLMYVHSIKSVKVEGTSRKMIHFINKDTYALCQEHWVEGVGSNYGPSRVQQGDCWHSLTDLVCYRYRDESNIKALYGGYCAPVGVEDVNPSQSEISIYPNPTSDQLNIQLAEGLGAMEITILSIDGRVMLNRNCTRKETLHQIPVQDYPTGIYLLQLTSGEQVTTFRFAKERL